MKVRPRKQPNIESNSMTQDVRPLPIYAKVAVSRTSEPKSISGQEPKIEVSVIITDIYVQPGASKTGPKGLHQNCLKLAIQAPPVDGAANEAVVDWFCETLDLPKSKVQIIQGEKSRLKRVAAQIAPHHYIQKIEAATLPKKQSQK